LDSHALLAELPRLRRYARALVGERAAADDLLQDTLERAWANARQWRGGSELRAWLFSIMHNLRVDQLRRAGPSMVPYEGEETLPAGRETASDGSGMLDLEAALARLPEDQRAVLLLVTLEDMRYEDVAETLGIPAGTVMSRLSRARERLRLLLDAQPNSSPTLRVVR